MNRRSFLTGLAGLSISNLLTGCSNQNRPGLSVRLLNGSVPPQILNQFQKQFSREGTSKFFPEPQLQTLFSQLQAWKNQKTRAVLKPGFQPGFRLWVAAFQIHRTWLRWETTG